MKLSYNQIKELMYKFLPNVYIVDLYDDHVVYEDNGKYYQAGYAIMDGELSLGEKVEVQKKVEYVKVQAAVRLSGAQEKGSEDYGYKWRVRVVEFGTDTNGTHWTKEPLVASLPTVFEGMKVFMLSEAQHQGKGHPYGKPPTEIIGWLSSATADESGIEADLNILKSAESLRGSLVDSWERGNPDLLGLSLDLHGGVEIRKVDGKRVRYLLNVKSATLDIVYEPAAGGKFVRMAAAKKGKENTAMLEKLLAALKNKRPSAYESIKAKVEDGTVTEDEVIELMAAEQSINLEDLDTRIQSAVEGAVEKIQAAQVKAGTGGEPGGGDGGGAGDDPLKAANKVLDDARVVACGVTLGQEIATSGLPDLSKARVKRQFEGKVFETEELRATITEEKEYIDKLTGSGGISDSGDIRRGEDELDKGKQMLDDFFERKVHSFKSAYIAITGDQLVTGDLKAAVRLRGAIDSTSWAEILGDAVTRRMVREYNSAGMDEWRKIVDVVPLSDFRTNRRPRMGGYGDLPAVAQGGAYNALTSPTDEEATYAATKRGGKETITIEAIKNDDVGSIRRIPVKLARAGKRTLHKFAFDFLAANGTIYDATALFTVGHGNLGTVALDAANLTIRRQAMLAQAEADSGEVLAIAPKYLIVPVELDKVGYDLIAAPRSSDFNPQTPDFTRTLQMELIVVPYWTDANNWYLAANPADIPTVEIGFLDGKEEPELFVQDMPNVGSMFTNDQLTYKIRHIYGGAVIDYRGLDGNVVV